MIHPALPIAPLIVAVAVAVAGCGIAATAPQPGRLPQVQATKASDSPGIQAETAAVEDAANHQADGDLSIYFHMGDTRVDQTGQQELRRHAARLKEHPRTVVTLAGSTDDLGSDSYNLAIAEQRIDAVARLLRAYGVARNQLNPGRRYAVEQGRLATTCRTAACCQKMRRVDLIYPPSIAL